MASRIFDTLRRAPGLSLLDWRYLAIAVRELLIARIRHATQPTSKILLELKEARRPLKVATATLDVARLSWAIAVAAARVPWRADCLLRAMAADRWLRRHHLQPQFYLGVKRNGAGSLAAHALLRLGDVTVTGDTVEAFTMLIAPSTDEAGAPNAPRWCVSFDCGSRGYWPALEY
jgi:Transglutaminase-like superfamily